MISGKRILQAQDAIREYWGEDALQEILQEIYSYKCDPMNYKEFLSHCIMCGGDWGAMLLSGIRKLYTRVWDAIPDDMGPLAFALIGDVMVLCQIDTSKDSDDTE